MLTFCHARITSVPDPSNSSHHLDSVFTDSQFLDQNSLPFGSSTHGEDLRDAQYPDPEKIDSIIWALRLGGGNTLYETFDSAYGKPGAIQYLPKTNRDSSVSITIQWIPNTAQPLPSTWCFKFYKTMLSKSEYHLYYPTQTDIQKLHGVKRKSIRQRGNAEYMRSDFLVKLDHFPDRGILATCAGRMIAFGKRFDIEKEFFATKQTATCDTFSFGKICWTATFGKPK